MKIGVPSAPTLHISHIRRFEAQKPLHAFEEDQILGPDLLPALPVPTDLSGRVEGMQAQPLLWNPEPKRPRQLPRTAKIGVEKGSGIGVELIGLVKIRGTGSSIQTDRWFASERPCLDVWMHEMASPWRAMAGHQESNRHGGVGLGNMRC